MGLREELGEGREELGEGREELGKNCGREVGSKKGEGWGDEGIREGVKGV